MIILTPFPRIFLVFIYLYLNITYTKYTLLCQQQKVVFASVIIIINMIVIFFESYHLLSVTYH